MEHYLAQPHRRLGTLLFVIATCLAIPPALLHAEDMETAAPSPLVLQENLPLPQGKQLSSSSQKTLQDISENLLQLPSATTGRKSVVIDHANQSASPVLSKVPVEGSHGIKMRGQTELTETSVNKLQEMAYYALMNGQAEAAIALYKRALERDKNNRFTLFGLATTYHRNNQIQQARDLYARILERNPKDRETLNNFLVLISQEAPEDALVQLQQLAEITPDFSPIPAQIGMIYLKQQKYDQAANYLKRALVMSPDNMTYRYNLAVLYDHMGNRKDATTLYRQILAANEQGATLPGSSSKIYERLNYLTNTNG